MLSAETMTTSPHRRPRCPAMTPRALAVNQSPWWQQLSLGSLWHRFCSALRQARPLHCDSPERHATGMQEPFWAIRAQRRSVHDNTRLHKWGDTRRAPGSAGGSPRVASVAASMEEDARHRPAGGAIPNAVPATWSGASSTSIGHTPSLACSRTSRAQDGGSLISSYHHRLERFSGWRTRHALASGNTRRGGNVAV